MKVRPATNTDRAAVIKIIGDTFQEYGDRLCLEGAESDLLDLEANYQEPDSAFVVVEIEDEIIGSHAVQRIEGGKFTFKRLYIRADNRGGGAGDFAFDWALKKARQLGAEEIEFWSDTRFKRAHRFFKKYHFIKGEERHMTDSFQPYSEFKFTRKF